MTDPAHIAITVASVGGLFAFSYFLLEIWEDKWQRKQDHERGRYTRRIEQSASSSESQPPTTQDDPSA